MLPEDWRKKRDDPCDAFGRAADDDGHPRPSDEFIDRSGGKQRAVSAKLLHRAAELSGIEPDQDRQCHEVDHRGILHGEER